MRQRFWLGSALLLLVGCGHPSAPSQAPVAAPMAAPSQAQATVQAATQQRREEIRATALPADYREQIDAAFVALLKDPDSRRIAFGRQPYGALICGSVNARNSYGGYTGQQPFVAYFGRTGRLADGGLVDWGTIKILQGLPPLLPRADP